jgi:hypothetical protein
VNGKHREQELGSVQETVGLQLRDGRNGVERSPANPERHGNEHYHPGNLSSKKINQRK